MREQELDQILEGMRGETASPEQVAAAQARVWQKLAAPPSAACSAFTADLTAYRQGTLPDQRRLLVEDHLSRCAVCRKELAERANAGKVAVMPAARAYWFAGWKRRALAAAVVLGAFYLGRGQDWIDRALAPSGPRATVASVSGSLYHLGHGQLKSGATLQEGDLVRTGVGARVNLRLADGSMVEMNERTELALQAAWSGLTINLERGDVIVQAARQRRGSLRVRTADSLASVKGTVFAVSASTTGSRVSVVEGSVQVDQAGRTRLLARGEQSATNAALESVPVRDAVSWSSNAENYYALLGELMKIESQLSAMPAPALRTQARLLPYLPDQVSVYVAIPNLDGTIRQGLSLIEQRAADSEVLRQWWESPSGHDFKNLAANFQSITPLVGDEIVMILTPDTPVILALVQPGRRAALEQALAKLNGASAIGYRVTDQLMIVTQSPKTVDAMMARLGRGAGSSFSTEIASRYQKGAGWLVGLDFAVLKAKLTTGPELASAALGLSQMKHLFLEWRQLSGFDENQAILTFQGARTGLASWLPEPGPAGSADYVSEAAVLALSSSTKNPRQALEDLLSWGSSFGLQKKIQELESATGLSIAGDIAPALGSNFAIAVERPTLPLPGVVLALEVNQSALLDLSLGKLVDSVNAKLGPDQAQLRLTLTRETINGRDWMSLRPAGGAATLHWTYDRGYMIASTDRVLVLNAIAARAGGAHLTRSAKFRLQLPVSASLYHSGFLWLNTQGAIADAASFFTTGVLKNLLANREPSLIVFDGETERIHAQSRTRLTSLLLDLMLAAGPAMENPKGAGKMKALPPLGKNLRKW